MANEVDRVKVERCEHVRGSTNMWLDKGEGGMARCGQVDGWVRLGL